MQKTFFRKHFLRRFQQSTRRRYQAPWPFQSTVFKGLERNLAEGNLDPFQGVLGFVAVLLFSTSPLRGSPFSTSSGSNPAKLFWFSSFRLFSILLNCIPPALSARFRSGPLFFFSRPFFEIDFWRYCFGFSSLLDDVFWWFSHHLFDTVRFKV